MWLGRRSKIPCGVTITRRQMLQFAALGTFGVSRSNAYAQIRIRIQPSAGGATGNGYTVTHYVSTTGNNTNSQAVYDAAANPATPCTFTVALARAVAGNIVQLAPGTYEGTIAGHGNSDPIFVPTNAGSSGNPIIFTAQYPAAYNLDTSLYTQFGRSDDVAPPGTSCPIWGSRNYAILDGVFFSYAQGAMPWTRGIVYYGFSITGMEVRRLLFERTDLGNDDDGDNYNCIQYHEALDCKVSDCWFTNGYGTPPMSHNESCITTYAGRNFTIEHCYFENVATAVYIKGTDGPGTIGNYGVIRYCNIAGNYINVELAISKATGTDVVEVTQNLITMASDGDHALAFDLEVTGSANRYFNVHHNTFIGAVNSSNMNGVVVVDNIASLGDGDQFANNIVAIMSASSELLVNTAIAVTGFAAWDYNRYYSGGSSPQFFLGSTRDGLAAWQSASSRDTNSTAGDPQFVNAGAGNYKLAGGSPCLTASSTGGPIGCYITGSEEIGLRAAPTY